MHALLIDIGNTSLKIGVAGIEGLVASYTLPTDTQQSGDGLGLQLAYLLCHAGFGTPGTGPGNVALDGCVISSVVPGMNPLVAHACERFLELTPRFAHRDLPIPLENRYERPNEVGADRLVGLSGHAACCRMSVPWCPWTTARRRTSTALPETPTSAD